MIIWNDPHFRTAFVTLLHVLNRLKIKLKDYEEDIDYHISRVEEFSQPLFIAVNSVRVNQSMFDKIDIV